MATEATNPDFNKWWAAVKDLSEFRGVTEAAAKALWQVAGGQMPKVEEEKGEPLPEEFQVFWANATSTSEFRGCTMAAAYAAWLDGQKHPIESDAVAKVRAATKRRTLPLEVQPEG